MQMYEYIIERRVKYNYSRGLEIQVARLPVVGGLGPCIARYRLSNHFQSCSSFFDNGDSPWAMIIMIDTQYIRDGNYN